MKQKTGLFILSIDNTDGILKAGMTGDIRIEVSSESNSIIIPKDAIVMRNGLYYVFKVIDNKTVQQKVVRGINNKEQVVILEGISEGDKVIRGNLGDLYDGKETK